MKIARSPYHASIAPTKNMDDHLWFCVIRREGSPEVVAKHNASSKEDAMAAALLELARLQSNSPARQRTGSNRF